MLSPARRDNRTHNSANNNAIGEHVIVVFAGRPARRCAVENQLTAGIHHHFCLPQSSSGFAFPWPGSVI
jgi:hypothetical protein